MILELGGGTNPHPEANVIIDTRHPRYAPTQDATVTPWMQCRRLYSGMADPIPDDSVDAIVSSHFLEHIPKGDPIISVMNEAHRVLRPGGTFTAIFPLVGYTDPVGGGHLVQSWHAYADPTHVQGWWLPESALYFCDGPFKPHADYGISTWAALGPFKSDTDPAYFTPGLAWPVDGTDSFYSVRGGWEGVLRMVKP